MMTKITNGRIKNYAWTKHQPEGIKTKGPLRLISYVTSQVFVGGLKLTKYQNNGIIHNSIDMKGIITKSKSQTHSWKENECN